ncbi:MAG: RsbRD N-terminal domain-containing protein [Pararhizobium sp.]
MSAGTIDLASILKSGFEGILSEWLHVQAQEGVKRTDLISAEETAAQSRTLLGAFARAAETGATDSDFDFANPAWDTVREALVSVSKSRTERGVSPTEAAWFVTSLKQALFHRLRRELEGDPRQLVEQITDATRVVDQVALYAFDG